MVIFLIHHQSQESKHLTVILFGNKVTIQYDQKALRQEDKESFYKNSNYHFTQKFAQQDEAVKPENYRNVDIVKLGQHDTVTSSDFFKRTGNSTVTPENPLLKTGLEHWKTTYQAGIVDPYAKNTAQRPEWSYNRPPYTVQSKVGPTEYKKQLGHLGENPRDRLDEIDDKNPRSFDILKLGTTQNSQFPPGYTGFIPNAITSSKAIDHGAGENPRHDFMKTNLKENQHTQIPGYAGHQPMAVQNQRQEPRKNCFGE
ncbi:hypothetical protein pb186bvf_007299 [Paramecium bursaria]